MPTPLPVGSAIRSEPPDADEAQLLHRGVVSAVAPATGLTPTQRPLIAAVFYAMTGFRVPADDPAPIGPAEFAAGLAGRTLQFRTRIVQVMTLGALVLRPIPSDVAERVEAFAAELLVEEGMLHVARRFADGSLGLAAVDFERNGYTASWGDGAAALHTTSALASAWETAVHDPDLAQRWADLEHARSDSMGRLVTEFYRTRGFVYPGSPGSAPPLLAQHDWVHVLADYGTTVESELEVFAFIARANDDMHAFSLLAMVVSLFETGYLRTGAGLFESSPGHLSEAGMAARVADAMRRGALCVGSVDFLLGVDWFDLADLSVAEARERFGVVGKSADAAAAGSVGPWDPKGISEYQRRAGAALAEREGRPYRPPGS